MKLSGAHRALLIMAVCGASAELFAASITGFGSASWQAPDATLGVSGYTIENFEDTALASGLQIRFTSPSLGGYGPTSTLPFTFDPTTDDCGACGAAFTSTLLWDGSKGLVNRPFVPITTYANDGGWGDVDFLFAAGAKSVGFSFGQGESGILISVDLGSGFVFLADSSSHVSVGSSRNGYLRIDAGLGETIFGVRLDNQSGNQDGLLYDHLAFSPVTRPGTGEVPEPATLLLFSAGLGVLALAKLRRH